MPDSFTVSDHSSVDEEWHVPPSNPVSNTPDQSIIKLQVGEQRFITTRQTLCEESPFFRALLASHWQVPVLDGHYFVDMDPDIFRHILRYLRHGVFPLLYHPSDGHDLAAYAALLRLADYLQIDKLATWLREQHYYKSVSVEVNHYPHELEPGEIFQYRGPRSAAVTEFHFQHGKKRVYRCPRGVPVHRVPADCGQKCKKAMTPSTVAWEEEGVTFVDRIAKMAVLETEYCFAD